jgi:hypothetical protein
LSAPALVLYAAILELGALRLREAHEQVAVRAFLPAVEVRLRVDLLDLRVAALLLEVDLRLSLRVDLHAGGFHLLRFGHRLVGEDELVLHLPLFDLALVLLEVAVLPDQHVVDDDAVLLHVGVERVARLVRRVDAQRLRVEVLRAQLTERLLQRLLSLRDERVVLEQAARSDLGHHGVRIGDPVEDRRVDLDLRSVGRVDLERGDRARVVGLTIAFAAAEFRLIVWTTVGNRWYVTPDREDERGADASGRGDAAGVADCRIPTRTVGCRS